MLQLGKLSGYTFGDLSMGPAAGRPSKTHNESIIRDDIDVKQFARMLVELSKQTADDDEHQPRSYR